MISFTNKPYSLIFKEKYTIFLKKQEVFKKGMLNLKNIYYGKFIKRYKRFFVDIIYENEVITIHNPNTGSMKFLLEEGREVAFTKSDNPKRKLPYTMEGIKVEDHWFYTNTIAVNKIVEAGIFDNEIVEFSDYDKVRREFKFKNSRIDFMIKMKNGDNLLVEVKNVTMFDKDYAYFPDAITSRGLKHLNTLADATNEGFIPYMFYVVQSPNDKFKCADFIDEEYCKCLEQIKDKVNILIYRNKFDVKNKTCSLVSFDNIQ